MDLTQICRMCMCMKIDLLNLENLGNVYEDKTLTDVLYSIFNKKYVMNDNQPKYICESCIMKSIDTYIFVVKCLSSYKYISKYIEINTASKLVDIKSKHTDSKDLLQCKNKLKIKYDIKTNSNEEEDLSEDEFLGFTDNLEEDYDLYEDNLTIKEELEDIKCHIQSDDEKHEEVEKIVIIVDDDKPNEVEAINVDLNIKDLIQNVKQEKIFDVKDHANNEILDSIHLYCDSELYVENEHIEKDCAVQQTEDFNDSNNILKCYSCNKSFKNKYILKAHIKRHQQQGQFSCTICEKVFNSQGCLTRHINTHTANNRYECEVCNKTFPTSHNLLLHSRTHSGVKPYLCTTCGRAFSHITSLTYHMRTHTNERPFQCHICGKQFTIQCHFDRHKKTHTGERPFQCDKCGKAFIKKFDLQRHQAIHNGDRPHKCTYCKKSFIRRLPLKLHMMVHTKERPHKCEFCGRGFIRAYYLKDHITKMHLNDDKVST